MKFTQLFILAIALLAGASAGMDATLLSQLMPIIFPDILPTAGLAQISRLGSITLSLFLSGWMVGGFVFGLL